MVSKQSPQTNSPLRTRTISLGQLIAAAYEVAGSAEAVAKMLESEVLTSKITSRRPMDLIRSAA